VRQGVKKLGDAGIFVSLFVDPDIEQIKVAGKMGAYQVEICTASYAQLNEHPGDATVRRIGEIEKELARIGAAARAATKAGLKVSAGHGLTYRNVGGGAPLTQIGEFNNGHNIIARAALVGLDRAVREMIEAIRIAQTK